MHKRYLAIILVTAAVVRLALLAAVWNHPGRIFAPERDTRDYVQLAESLAGRNSFSRGGEPEIFRTPGYPLFLIPSLAFGASYWRAAVAAQIALDVLLVYLTVLLGTMLAGRRVGLWAGAFQAITAAAVVAGVSLLSDSLYALLLTLSICLMVLHFKTGKWWPLVASACVLAAGCYVRPVGLVMAAVFAGVLLFRPGRVPRTAAFVGILLAAVAPWVIRNYVTARYVGFSSYAGDAMYFFAVPELEARLQGADPAVLRAECKAQAAARAQGPPGPRAAARHREALAAIAEHPWLYARLHLRGCLGTYLPDAPSLLELIGITQGHRGTSDVLRKEGVLAAARFYFGDNLGAMLLAAPMVLLLAIQYFGVAVCAVRKARLHMPAEVWLAAAVVTVSTLLPGPYGLPRYRVPMVPLLGVAAAAGLTMLIDAFRRRRGAT